MLTGIRIQAQPNAKQKLILSQWMGCARFVWNAKCDEDRYLSSFARKFLPIGTYAPIDQKFSQYKDQYLSPWLSECPSQILRNSATNWYQTYQKFLKKDCGKPKRKNKSASGSVHLTQELFKFETGDDGVFRLFIGTKTNNIGCLLFKKHRPFETPKSIYIKKRYGAYWLAFCYEDNFDSTDFATQEEHLKYLKKSTLEYLQSYTVGIDRGVVRPIQAGEDVFDFTQEEKISKAIKEKYIKRYQKRMARQKKGSKRRYLVQKKLADCHQKIANIRKDFCHKASHALVQDCEKKVFILEDLKAKNMTAKPKAKQDESGRWLNNGARAKAGLNKAILDKGWHLFESYIKYKSYRAGKAWFKIPSHHTSQECAACEHIHPDNRQSQEVFVCERCGHTDNADHNAAEVIKKRAIKRILDTGTVLSKRGVLLETGRGAKVRHGERKVTYAVAAKRQKRREKREASFSLVPEAHPLQGVPSSA